MPCSPKKTRRIAALRDERGDTVESLGFISDRLVNSDPPDWQSCDETVLPGDVNTLPDPLGTVDLLHYEVGYIFARDSAAVGREGVAVDAVVAVGGRVGEHGRHDHGPVEVAAGEIVPLRDLGRY